MCIRTKEVEVDLRLKVRLPEDRAAVVVRGELESWLDPHELSWLVDRVVKIRSVSDAEVQVGGPVPSRWRPRHE